MTLRRSQAWGVCKVRAEQTGGRGRYAAGRSGRFLRLDRAPPPRPEALRIGGLDEHHRRQSLSQWQADRPGLARSAGPLCNRSLRIRLDRTVRAERGGAASTPGELRLAPAGDRGRAPRTPAAQSSTSMATSCSSSRAQPISWTAKSAMARPRSSLAKPSSSASATDRSARIPGSVSRCKSSPGCSSTASTTCSTLFSTSLSMATCRSSRRSRRRCFETGAILDAFLEREEIGRLFTLRRELIRFQRVLGPMHEVCNKLTHVSLPALDREVRPYFQDVLDHVRRVRRGSGACAKFSPRCSRRLISSSSNDKG